MNRHARLYVASSMIALLGSQGCKKEPESEIKAMPQQKGTAPTTTAPVMETEAPVFDRVMRSSAPTLRITHRNQVVATNFNYTTATPDGRVVVRLSSMQGQFSVRQTPRTAVAGGKPTLSQTFSPAVTARMTGTRPQRRFTARGLIFTNGNLDGAVNYDSGGVVLAHDPRVSPWGKPIPVSSFDECKKSDEALRAYDPLSGTVTPLEGARYLCYRLLQYHPVFLTGGMDQAHARVLFQAQLAVMLDTEDDSIENAEYLTALEPSRVRGSAPENPEYLWALEPTATSDGRLYLAEGGIYSYNPTPWDPSTWSKQKPIYDLRASGNCVGLSSPRV